MRGEICPGTFLYVCINFSHSFFPQFACKTCCYGNVTIRLLKIKAVGLSSQFTFGERVRNAKHYTLATIKRTLNIKHSISDVVCTFFYGLALMILQLE